MRFLSVVIILSFVWIGSSQAWAKDQTAKNLIVKTIHNQIFDLSSLKNKVVVVAFWADWCSVCRVEIVQLDNLYKKYHSQGLEIIGLNVDGQTRNAADLSYPIAIADNADKNDFDDPKTLPLIYIVSKDGLVLSKLELPEEVEIGNVQKIVESLLK